MFLVLCVTSHLQVGSWPSTERPMQQEDLSVEGQISTCRGQTDRTDNITFPHSVAGDNNAVMFTTVHQEHVFT